MATQLENRLRTILKEKLEKIKPENIKEGVTILDVEGTLKTNEDNIKLFKTFEEMMTCIPQENAYGVVYDTKEYPVTLGCIAHTVILKETVILDEAVTGYVSWYDSSMKFRVTIQPTTAQIRWSGKPSKNISYTSTDGITYTTTATLEDRTINVGDYTFDERSPNSWKDTIGEFMTAKGNFLDGIYEYVDKSDIEWYNAIKRYIFTDTIITSENEPIYAPFLATTIQHLNDSLYIESGSTIRFFVYRQNGKFYAQRIYGKFGKILNDNSIYAALTPQYSKPELGSNDLYELNLETQTFTLIGPVKAEFIAGQGGDTYGWKKYSHDDITIIGFFADGKYEDAYITYTISGSTTTSTSSYTINYTFGNTSILAWHRINTQFNLENGSQLYPGITALGKHGPITGNEDIWKSVPLSLIYEQFGLQKSNLAGIYGDSTEYFSNVYDNKSLTYLEADENGQYVIGKPKKLIDINYISNEGETLAPGGLLLWDDTMTYCCVISYFYDSSTSPATYDYTLRLYNKSNELLFTKVLHADIGAGAFADDSMGIGFKNNILYISSNVDKCIYSLNCKTLEWSTYTTDYVPFVIVAGKYMVMGKVNKTSSTMSNSIRFVNLDTNAKWDYTYYGNTSANSFTTLPQYYTDGVNGYFFSPGTSSSNGYAYILTPTDCKRVSTVWWATFSYTSTNGIYTLPLSGNRELIIPRESGSKTSFSAPIINKDNNTVSVITFNTAELGELSVNSDRQLVYSPAGNITIYEPGELNISGSTFTLPYKTPEVIDLPTSLSGTKYWGNRLTGSEALSMQTGQTNSFWFKRNGKIYFEIKHKADELRVATKNCVHAMSIELTKCSKTNIKPVDIDKYVILLQANSNEDYKKRINPIIFHDGIL